MVYRSLANTTSFIKGLINVYMCIQFEGDSFLDIEAYVKKMTDGQRVVQCQQYFPHPSAGNKKTSYMGRGLSK